MIITKIVLNNWGPYQGTVELAFDEAANGRNVCLVRGDNGSGKTSLLYALVVGLHGDAYLNALGLRREPRESRRAGYVKFLHETLSTGADDYGDLLMGVEIHFAEASGSFVVARRWWFDSRDAEPEEELTLLLDGMPYRPLAATREDQEEELANLIQSRVPVNVTKFFFFDGEEIRTIADRDPTQQVIEGLDALLGFRLIKDLMADVEKARTDFQQHANKGKSAQVDLAKLNAEVVELESQNEQLTDEIRALERNRENLETEIRQLEQRISSFGGGSGASGRRKAELITELQTVRSEQRSVRKEISRLIGNQLSVAYPAQLIEDTESRIRGELALRDWQLKRENLEPECEKLSERLFGATAPEASPPLTGSQRTFYRRRLVDEWKLLLHPPPEGVPDAEWFTILTSEELQLALHRCSAIREAGRADLASAISRYRELMEDDRKLTDRIDRYESDEEVGRLVADLEELAKSQGRTEEDIERSTGELRLLETRLAEKRREQTNKLAQAASSGLVREQLMVANDALDALKEFQNRLRRDRVTELQQSIEEMMQQLAHKGEDLFASIEIDPDTFRLVIRDPGGKEVRHPSEGEKEILALSMIWSLGRISRRDLPLVIDTPVGRLDNTHRRNILERFLPNAAKQVIVLATDAEIDDEWEALFASSIAGKLELDHDPKEQRTSVARNVSLA